MAAAGTAGLGPAGGSSGSSSSDAGAAGERPVEELEPLVPIASGEEEPYRIAIDDQYVYWTNGTALRRAPFAGGDASTLATGSIGHLAVGVGFVYFADSLSRTVARVSRNGGNVEGIADSTYVGGITLGSAGVYWSNPGISGSPPGDGSLAMAAFDGSTRSVLADGLLQPAGVAVDDDFVYFSSIASGCSASSEGMSCSGGGVNRVPLGGGEPEVVDAEGTPIELVMHDERGLYWMVDSTVKHSPRGTGAVETVITLADERSGPIAVDEDYLYLGSTGNGRVVRIPLDGGSPLRVAVDLGEVGGVAVDANWLYVAATSQGRILRIAKDGSAAQPDGPITGPCPAPVGGAEEIEQTPREDENLELLSLRIDEGQVTASQDTYERVVADVAAIRALEPALADIRYAPPHDGRTIVLRPGELALSSMGAGEYLAWDCLDDFYGVRSREIANYSTFSLVTIELDGIYALDLVAGVYSELPGVEHAEPGGERGNDGPTICASRTGATFEYVLDDAGGDCLLGCTTHGAHRFVSTAPGEVEAREVWNSVDGADPPEWFLTSCR
jgi:hypothetical protein